MRILIVGAGISGLTLTSLLKQRNITPDVIDKASSFGEVGYMIGLYPLGSSIFHGLQCYDNYLSSTQKLNKYQAYDNNGDLLQEYSLANFTKRYGDYQCTSRYTLLDVIHKTCQDIPIKFSTTVISLEQTENEVSVKFSDGSTGVYDLVIGSDGINSHIRDLILSPHEYETFNTSWGGFVWWGDKTSIPHETVCEFWGDKFFFGAYPTETKNGLIIACHGNNAEEALQGKPRKEFLLSTCSKIVEKHPALFKDLPNDDQPMFYWALKDIKCKVWHKNRVLLLGDAATAFLPTAGVGASMAMESASVLNDILSRTNKKYVTNALEMYYQRRHKRVESTQEDSRKLAKMMFIDSYIGNKTRDVLFKMLLSHMDIQDFMKSVAKAMSTPA